MGRSMWDMGLGGRDTFGGFGRYRSPMFSGGFNFPPRPKKQGKIPRWNLNSGTPGEEPEDDGQEEFEAGDFTEEEAYGEKDPYGEEDYQEDFPENEYEDEESTDLQEEEENDAGKKNFPDRNILASDSERDVSSMNLQKAIVWAEILGEPVSRKRRKKRMGQLYGDQGYAGRR